MRKFINFFGILLLSLMTIGVALRIFHEKNNGEIAETPSPKVFTLNFDPPMERHCEVIIDFDKKNIIFKKIDNEPIPLEKPPRPDGTRTEETDKPTEVIPFVATLSEQQINEVRTVIKSLQKEDYKIVDGNYIDVISYNFSVTLADKTIKVGNIAKDKNPKQSRLVSEILGLVETLNKHAENEKILAYYKHFN